MLFFKAGPLYVPLSNKRMSETYWFLGSSRSFIQGRARQGTPAPQLYYCESLEYFSLGRWFGVWAFQTAVNGLYFQVPPGVTLWASPDLVNIILFGTGKAVTRSPVFSFLHPATDCTEACYMIHLTDPEGWAEALCGCTKASFGYWWLGAG